MSQRFLFELNTDYFRNLETDPAGFVRHLKWALNDSKYAEELRYAFGVQLIEQRHHSNSYSKEAARMIEHAEETL